MARSHYQPINQIAPGKSCLEHLQTSGLEISEKKDEKNKPMKAITNIIYFGFALFAFAWFALLPQARAVCQEGCLTNNNTALGKDALNANTAGSENTANGFQALFSNTVGNFNTATA